MDAQEITFEVAGDPVPQPRARAGAGGRFYTPGKRIRVYQQAIAIRAALEAKANRWQRADGPIAMSWHFVFARPPSHRNKAGELTKKAPLFPGQNCGDIDNLQKAVMDALTAAGTIWVDDRQVCQVDFCSKRFAAPGEAPRTFVRIRRL